MKAKLALGICGAGVAGIFCGYAICASIACRGAIAKLFGAGELVALVHGSGVFERDVTRRAREMRYRLGDESGIRDEESQKSALIAEAALDFVAHNEKISRAAITREYELLQWQIADKGAWAAALHANGLCAWTVRTNIAKILRDRQWIDRQVAPQVAASAEECRAFFEEHQAAFVQPIRFRAAHLFLAAPPETPPEVVDVKRRTIEELATRLSRGEPFVDFVAQFSEDEATKKRGGDLGYFSEFRMPADFMGAIRQLHPGETSPIVQTKLGFHIIQFVDLKTARQMTFEEARPEIEAQIENTKRRALLQTLVANLSRQSDFRR